MKRETIYTISEKEAMMYKKVAELLRNGNQVVLGMDNRGVLSISTFQTIQATKLSQEEELALWI